MNSKETFWLSVGDSVYKTYWSKKSWNFEKGKVLGFIGDTVKIRWNDGDECLYYRDEMRDIKKLEYCWGGVVKELEGVKV